LSRGRVARLAQHERASHREVFGDHSSGWGIVTIPPNGGKTNYVWMRWVSPTGERGPWSEQAQATIAA